MQRYVRLSAEVRDVDAGPPAVHEHPKDFGKDRLEQLPVLCKRQVPVVCLAHVVRGRGHCKVHAGIWKPFHPFAALAQDLVGEFGRHGVFGRGCAGLFVVIVQLAAVEF